jgi:hypothetical protein
LDKRSSSPSTDLDDADTSFSPLNTPIPTDSLLEDDFLTALSFSKRGSIMLGGQRALSFDGTMDSSEEVAQRNATSADNNASISKTPVGATDAAPAAPTIELHTPSTVTPAADAPALNPDIRVLAADVERESEKVRSFYAAGEALNWEDGAPSHAFHEHLEPTLEAPVEEDEEHDPYACLYDPRRLHGIINANKLLCYQVRTTSHPRSAYTKVWKRLFATSR